MLVHWYRPTARSRCIAFLKCHVHKTDSHVTSWNLLGRERNAQYSTYNFEEDNDHQRVANRQRGHAAFRVISNTQQVPQNTIHFGFNRLNPSGGLPPEVQRRLRDLGVIAAATVVRRR